MTTLRLPVPGLRAALPLPRSDSDQEQGDVASRLLLAQRRVSHLLQDLADGGDGWELRTAVLAEAARLVDGVAAIVAIGLPEPLLASSDPQRTDDTWRPLLAELVGTTSQSPLLDQRTVALRIRGTDEHLVAQAGRRLAPLDVFLLEPLTELLAVMRMQELVEVRARVRERQDALTGLPNSLALSEQLERLDRRRTDGAPGVTVLRVRLLDADLHAVLGDALVTAAAAVRAGIREEDMVAHLGGATFAVLCDGVATHEALAVAERVRSHIFGHLREASAGTTVEVQVVPTSPGPDDHVGPA